MSDGKRCNAVNKNPAREFRQPIDLEWLFCKSKTRLLFGNTKVGLRVSVANFKRFCRRIIYLGK